MVPTSVRAIVFTAHVTIPQSVCSLMFCMYTACETKLDNEFQCAN